MAGVEAYISWRSFVEMGMYCLCVEMLTSQVSRCDHPAVQLQFFETVVRYEKFFGTEPQFLPDVLVSSSS